MMTHLASVLPAGKYGDVSQTHDTLNNRMNPEDV